MQAIRRQLLLGLCFLLIQIVQCYSNVVIPEEVGLDSEVSTIEISDEDSIVSGQRRGITNTKIKDYNPFEVEEVYYTNSIIAFEQRYTDLTDEIFADRLPRVKSKTEAYLMLADQFDMNFFRDVYKRVKGYENKTVRDYKPRFSHGHKLRVKVKIDLDDPRVISTYTLDRFQKIQLRVGAEEQSIMYRVDMPIHRVAELPFIEKIFKGR